MRVAAPALAVLLLAGLREIRADLPDIHDATARRLAQLDAAHQHGR
ncbi:hypothetical protein H7691_00185 [Stenotrophomonas sp. CW117]|jgi:hypothetical protein|nr:MULTISPECIES: hypothetical protein [Stenotrophomonas]QOF98648.1 hypothetical protein H7691_00185 [Stenotrophomonas sp. CW117]